jgi:arginine-tRNA-protein transferase
MYSRIRYPDQVAPSELDDYLEAGWRCAGQAIYTAHFMRFPATVEGRIYSTLPTRLPLKGYTFKKRLRKLWRRVHRTFRVETGQPFVYDSAAQQVHQRYEAAFSDRGLADEDVYQEQPSGPFTFDTRSIRIYDGDQLVAFSVFNLGQRSIYSSQGIYDPDYARHSLGFFSMLAEINYGVEEGLSYYYPGYVVPGYDEFDYKLRVGDMEYYDLSSDTWHPYKALKPEQVPINRMWAGLSALQEELNNNGTAAHLAEYALFDIRFWEHTALPFVEHPLVLLCASPSPKRYCPLAVLDPQDWRYTLYNAKFFGMGVHHLPTYKMILKQRPKLILEPIAAMEKLAEGLNLEEAGTFLSEKAYL